MAEETLTTTVELSFHRRVRHGVRRPHNWFQLGRFATVGGIGYGVNIVVFALCVHALGIDYRIASAIAFVVAVSNNFWWNRHWTFSARADHPARQGVRFFAVSLLAFGLSEAVLVALVSGAGMSKVLSQAIAIVAATPLSFVGQKLWSFRA
ncbi:MAG: GtrA family protein [Actinomycetota bacterium]|jgi:putative flippase GtrA|nr:GtrA family protein [Actinomycetota bacterium]